MFFFTDNVHYLDLIQDWLLESFYVHWIYFEARKLRKKKKKKYL